ncbi:MAG: SBBP repeat-containing protein, partial [Thermodesulfobacteriota bacterium]
LEYDVIVKPGADPNKVRFLYEGISGLSLTGDGELQVGLKEETKLLQKKLFIYQDIDGKRVEVEGAFKVEDLSTSYGFKVASYDRSKELVIDPQIDFSTYLGGSEREIGFRIFVDGNNNTYVTGSTESCNFPTEVPFDFTHNDVIGRDAFVTKINAAGTALVYSTYLGGTSDDLGRGIAVDNTGAAYVGGQTQSSDFPIIAGSFDTTSTGNNWDVFVTKISANGSALIYSTYLNGNGALDGDDTLHDLTIDSNNSAYVTGQTKSSSFPVTTGAYDTLINNTGVVNNEWDVYVTMLDPAGANLVYSTFIGGNLSENAFDIAVDSHFDTYITGTTFSTNYPVIAGIFPTHSGGGIDAFVTKIDSTGTNLIYSTFLGGSGADISRGIAVDSFHAVYVTGETRSTNFPTAAPIFATHSGGGTDAFVTKITPDGKTILFSTYLGGTGADIAHGIALNSNDDIYVAGETTSTDFPFINQIPGVGAAISGTRDGFVTMINDTGTGLIYSTYLGGANNDIAWDIAVDNCYAAYITGETTSTDFPVITAPMPIFGINRGLGDAFVAKLEGSSQACECIQLPTGSPSGVVMRRNYNHHK